MLEFRFPDIGEGITEGVILKWFVEVGQEVKEGDSLFLVETDKVNAEIPSPANGTILARFGEVGDTINVGDVVVQIGEAGAKAPRPQAEPVAEDNAAVVGALETSDHVLATSSEHEAAAQEPPRRSFPGHPRGPPDGQGAGGDINTL